MNIDYAPRAFELIRLIRIQEERQQSMDQTIKAGVDLFEQTMAEQMYIDVYDEEDVDVVHDEIIFGREHEQDPQPGC